MMNVPLALLAIIQTTDPCTHHVVRVAQSRSGIIAIERNRICTVNALVVTGQNEIYVRRGRRDKRPPILVARTDSVGRTGLPLSWAGNILTIHFPAGFDAHLLRERVGNVSIKIARDYSDEAQLRDAGR